MTNKVINILRSELEASGSEDLQLAILISSRLNELEREKQIGTLSFSEWVKKKNEINESTLKLVDKIFSEKISISKQAIKPIAGKDIIMSMYFLFFTFIIILFIVKFLNPEKPIAGEHKKDKKEVILGAAT